LAVLNGGKIELAKRHAKVDALDIGVAGSRPTKDPMPANPSPSDPQLAARSDELKRSPAVRSGK